jgi:ABC-type sugar transport system substrate-binding protein
VDSKVGIFVNALDGYHGRIVGEVERAAASEGIEVEVFDAQHSAMKQAQELVRFQFDNAGKRLCVFVIPEADAMGEADLESSPTFQQAQRALQKGIGWLMLNHGRDELVTLLRQRFPRLPVALVAIDNLDFGRVQGKQLRRLLPGGGRVLCVRGNPQDSACLDRSQGLRKELEGSGISVEEIDARWSDDVALASVGKWLASPLRRGQPLDAVVAQNDQMACAARKALVAAAGTLARGELARLPVLGGDGLPDIGKPWVDDHTLTATVCVTLPGRPALELLARHWREGAPLPAVTRIPVTSYPPLAALTAQAS